MLHKRLHDLRACRRRASLSQRDIAILLGIKAISKISRYERNVMLPPLKTALAYQAICGRPVAALFRESYGEIRKEVQARAAALLEKTAGLHRIVDLKRKESLQAIIHR